MKRTEPDVDDRGDANTETWTVTTRDGGRTSVQSKWWEHDADSGFIMFGGDGNSTAAAFNADVVVSIVGKSAVLS